MTAYGQLLSATSTLARLMQRPPCSQPGTFRHPHQPLPRVAHVPKTVHPRTTRIIQTRRQGNKIYQDRHCRYPRLAHLQTHEHPTTPGRSEQNRHQPQQQKANLPSRPLLHPTPRTLRTPQSSSPTLDQTHESNQLAERTHFLKHTLSLCRIPASRKGGNGLYPSHSQ
ncbi:hypothetical protein BJX68DRAFT_250040 [Aspergillus pseudodeflectus]|uniref:Uncharacterized protein n=1 Tax=Aspergillus pseudodeflectus TaxID=176178 RepID=A0ABR4JAG2_9EURO